MQALSPSQVAQVSALDIVIAVVAVYGAFLSTWNAVRDRHRDQTNLSVQSAYSYLQYGPQLSAPYLTIHVTNNSSFAVTASSGGLELLPGRNSPSSNARQLFFRAVPELQSANMALPQEIRAKHGGAFGQLLEEIRSALSEAGYRVDEEALVRPFVTISTGQRFYGPRRRITVAPKSS
jgi:hypothetical protein